MELVVFIEVFYHCAECVYVGDGRHYTSDLRLQATSEGLGVYFLYFVRVLADDSFSLLLLLRL